MSYTKQTAILLGCLLLLVPAVSTHAQYAVISDNRFDSLAQIAQKKALQQLIQEDTITASAFWPHIQPRLFFANLRRNVEHPTQINQGASTNFCAYAAMTHLLVKYHPDIYVKHIINLFRLGTTSLRRRRMYPSERVRQAAGTLDNKGELDVLHADQLWFLALADEFKGYINFIDHRYHKGDENKLWASCNYAKFNRMLRDFTRDRLTAAGSDFIRPWKSNFYNYISGQISKGVVILYVNSKYLYPHRYSFFKLRAPTHFIVAYEMHRSGSQIVFRYWDYGLKTEQLITRRRLKQLIFGVTTITSTVNEEY